jgi:hypothetical protein
MRTGESSYRHLGNAPTVQYTPNIEWLNHNSAMEGIRSRDAREPVEKTAQIVIQLEEWDPLNIELWAFGEMTGSPPVIDLLAEDEITGALRVIGTNTRGVRCQWDWPSVSFGPSSTLDLVTDEWASMELTGEVLGPDFGTVRPDITAEVLIGSPPV